MMREQKWHLLTKRTLLLTTLPQPVLNLESNRSRKEGLTTDSAEPGNSIGLKFFHNTVSELPLPHSVHTNNSVGVPKLVWSRGRRGRPFVVPAVTIPVSSTTPQLQVQYTSPNQGFIQTPGWDGETRVDFLMDSCVHITAPPGSLIMVSHVGFYFTVATGRSCNHNIVRLFSTSNCTGRSYWSSICNAFPNDYRQPIIVRSGVLSVKCRISNTFEAFKLSHVVGFRVQFSIHSAGSDLPRQIGNSKTMWNCSVTNWAEVKQHFPCNLHRNCVNGEDEADCPYTTDLCGKGRFQWGHKCYAIITWHFPSRSRTPSTTDASEHCIRHGGHLASLSSDGEIEGVLKVLNINETPQYPQLLIGLSLAGRLQPDLYQRAFQWSDGIISYHPVHISLATGTQPCGNVIRQQRPKHCERQDIPGLYFTACYANPMLCEMSPVLGGLIKSPEKTNKIPARAPTASYTSDVTLIRCPANHTTHVFLSCDVFSACWRQSDEPCHAPLTPLPPSFTCAGGVMHVPYTLVCDFRSDCGDNSDEDFCVFPPCIPLEQFECGRKQCIRREYRCDGAKHCLTGLDETDCYDNLKSFTRYQNTSYQVVDFMNNGTWTFTSGNYTNSNTTFPCPETHFKCPGTTLCLPVYVRCNDVPDCPGREDEEECDSYVCDGFYRCRNSKACLHPKHVCDDVWQCPQRDDELLCDFTCPQSCICYGLALFCHSVFQISGLNQLRFLDARGTGMTLADVQNNTMLIYLSLASCGLTHIGNFTLHNLQTLDLSDNQLVSVTGDDMSHLFNLKTLFLSGNPVKIVFPTAQDRPSLLSLRTLHLSRVYMEEIDIVNVSQTFPNLETLNLTDCGIQHVLGEGFQSLINLHALDIRGCPMKRFPPGIFTGLSKLTDVYSDNYKLCCAATLPEGFNLARCRAPQDGISSCDALLRSDSFRIVLSVFAVLALFGNLGSFGCHVFTNKNVRNTGYGVFVTHLCVSDFLMGVYLSVIGVADRLYFGTYLWEDVKWKQSSACKTAGCLSLVSNEVSAFIICLITLDRFLAIRFPFSTLHFNRLSAHAACGVIWMIGVTIAVVPLMTSHWEFYGQTGICIPLPITTVSVDGHSYSFSVMIVLNFVLFLLIAAGQVLIYWSVQKNSVSTSSTNKISKDLTIARRLIAVVMSDFLCWFPIGLLGLMSSNGVPVSGEVNVAMAIFVLPCNSALNPFLYTFNMLLERRQKANEQRLRRTLLADLKKRYGNLNAGL